MKQYISEETLLKNKYEVFYLTPKGNIVYQKKGKKYQDNLVVRTLKNIESFYETEQTYYEIIKIMGTGKITEGIQLSLEDDYINQIMASKQKKSYKDEKNE